MFTVVNVLPYNHASLTVSHTDAFSNREHVMHHSAPGLVDPGLGNKNKIKINEIGSGFTSQWDRVMNTHKFRYFRS